jgi:outer membrane protein
MGGVALKQLVYDFDQTRNLVRQSQALERVAESSLNAAQLQVVYSVKAAFYNYAYAEQLVKVNEQNVENRRRQYDLAEERLTTGVGLPSDVVTALTSKSQGILALNIARDNAEQARISLLIQMGIDPMTPIVLDESRPARATIDDPRLLVKIALKKRPEVRAAVNNVLASKFGLSAARSVNAPSVYLGMAAGTRGQDFPLDDSTVSFQLGIAIPIYDGGLRAGAVQTSRGQLTAAQAQLQSTLLSVQNDVASAYLSYKSAEQRVTIAENEVLNALEGVRIAEGRYRSGLGQFQDITTAQALLLGALTDQTLARNAQDVAENQVRFSTGEALDGLDADLRSASPHK